MGGHLAFELRMGIDKDGLVGTVGKGTFIYTQAARVGVIAGKTKLVRKRKRNHGGHTRKGAAQRQGTGRQLWGNLWGRGRVPFRGFPCARRKEKGARNREIVYNAMGWGRGEIKEARRPSLLDVAD